MDLPSVLGGLAQGFVDFGKSAVDLFGTGGAAFADLIQGTGTKNQDDFRKWLYKTDSVQDAAAKGLGTALNGAQTISDYVIPGGISKSLLFNAGQGALGGLADEFKTYGENYDLGRAGQRALVSAGAAGAGTGLANALKKSSSGLLQSGLAQGASRGALSGAINQGGYAAIDGGDIAQSALQGAGMGALLGGATGMIQDLKPRKLTPAEMALTDSERQARIANAKDMLEDARYTVMSATPGDGTDIVAANNRVMELRKYINALEGGYDNVRDYDAAMAKAANGTSSDTTLDATLANADMAVNNPKLSPEQQAYFESSVLRDEQGNLMPVYHSTPNKFTTFDDNMLGENTGYENTGYGHFVTPDKDFSARFKGDDGNTMELYANVKNPITHPYNAGLKYKGKELDDIVENWLKATGNSEVIDDLKLEAKANKTSLYDEYMNMMGFEDVYEYAPEERQRLQNAGYDAVELLEGRRDQLIDGSSDETPVSSYAIFSGNQLKDINNLKPTSDVDIMASRMTPGELDLARALARQDMAVNSADKGISVYTSDLDPKTKRAIELITNQTVPADNELYNRIDPTTLPQGYEKLRNLVDNPNAISADIEKKLGKNPYRADIDELLDYLYPNEPLEKRVFNKSLSEKIEKNKKTAAALGLDVKQAADDAKLAEKIRLIEKIQGRAQFDAIADIGKDIDVGDDIIMATQDYRHRGIRTGYPGALDTALSERLDIAPGNTIKITDSEYDWTNNGDDYSRKNLGRYTRNAKDIAIREGISGVEGDISTLAHERLHSFQNEAKPENKGRYSKEVADAYNELSKDLKPFIKDKATIEKLYGGADADYYASPIEQESRMLQTYLDDKGYTDKALSLRNKFIGGKPEWGNEINPAFDKFIDKLRDLSKRGVALPALAGLVGGGAVLEQILNSKDEDKKKTNKRSA